MLSRGVVRSAAVSSYTQRWASAGSVSSSSTQRSAGGRMMFSGAANRTHPIVPGQCLTAMGSGASVLRMASVAPLVGSNHSVRSLCAAAQEGGKSVGIGVKERKRWRPHRPLYLLCDARY
eukprot:438980-Rhodomonas_salina.3